MPWTITRKNKSGSRPCDDQRERQYTLALSFRIGQVNHKYNVTNREVVTIIVRPFTYDSEAYNVLGRKGNIRIENLSPQLSCEERLQQRKCIEEGLFEIFIKYTNLQENHSYLGAAAV